MQGKRTNPYYVAQDILSRRDHAEGELRQKLQRKRFTATQIDDVVARLKTQRLLNDRVFAQRYVESILRTKAVGPRWLRAKLLQKGVAGTIAAVTIQRLLPPAEEQRLCQLAAERWRTGHRQHAADLQRLRRFLLSRGFSPDAMATPEDY